MVSIYFLRVSFQVRNTDLRKIDTRSNIQTDVIITSEMKLKNGITPKKPSKIRATRANKYTSIFEIDIIMTN